MRALWQIALAEHASPRAVASAVALGVFIGCTPALGFHGWLAVGAATLLRLNRLWTFLGSRVSNVLVLPWIVLAEVQITHRLRTGGWLAFDADTAFRRAPELLLDWSLGTLPVGGALASIAGGVAYVLARRREGASS